MEGFIRATRQLCGFLGIRPLTRRHGARYVKDLLQILGSDFGKSGQDVYRMVFGTELESGRFGERPMSKFKHDLLEQMMVLKNGHYLRK